MSSNQDFFYAMKKLLSQQIGKLNPDIEETAMLHPDERFAVAACRAYIKGFGKTNPKFCKWLEETGIPMLKLLGYGKWPRTELTDLGLKLSNKDESEQSIQSEQEVVEQEIRE